MPMFELIQEMMFVNMCVKFHNNPLRNEVCRAVTPLGHVRTNVRTNVCTYVRTYVQEDPYILCEGIIMVDRMRMVKYNMNVTLLPPSGILEQPFWINVNPLIFSCPFGSSFILIN